MIVFEEMALHILNEQLLLIMIMYNNKPVSLLEFWPTERAYNMKWLKINTKIKNIYI
jgi:hypothetical protein